MKYFFFFLFFSLFAVREKVEYIELGSEIQDPVKIKSFEKVKPKNIILLIGDVTGFNQKIGRAHV